MKTLEPPVYWREDINKRLVLIQIGRRMWKDIGVVLRTFSPSIDHSKSTSNVQK